MSARNIETKMVAWIDKKLAGNGSAQHAIEMGDARSVFIHAVEACVGIREEGGNNKGPMVKLIQETLGGADSEAWCMAFMQTCIAYAEVKTGIVSPIYPSEHCLTTWGSTPKKQRVKTFPAQGAIIIWRHGSGPAGHTGMFSESTDGKTMHAIEGNTEGGLSPTGAVERDGGGVYFTSRSMKGTGNMKVVGFLKPF